MQRAYLGTELVDDVLYLKPLATAHLDGLRLPMQVRGTPLVISIDRSGLTVAVPSEGDVRPITVNVDGVGRELHAGQSATFTLPLRATAVPAGS